MPLTRKTHRKLKRRNKPKALPGFLSPKLASDKPSKRQLILKKSNEKKNDVKKARKVSDKSVITKSEPKLRQGAGVGLARHPRKPPVRSRRIKRKVPRAVANKHQPPPGYFIMSPAERRRVSRGDRSLSYRFMHIEECGDAGTPKPPSIYNAWNFGRHITRINGTKETVQYRSSDM